MKKRVLSCILVMAMIAGLFPATVFHAAAAETPYGRIDIEMSTRSGQPYIKVDFKIQPTAVKISIVPAGTKPADISTATSIDMSDNFGSWEYYFDSADIISDIGDFNIWFFIDDDTEPVTDNMCWRAFGGSVNYYITFNGLDPARSYAEVTGWTTTTFTLTAYSILGETYFELIKRADGTVVKKVDVTHAGTETYTFDTDWTGSYILRYTRDGKSQNIGYISLLGGKLPFAVLRYSTKAKLDSSNSSGSITGWSKGENSPTGNLKVNVYVENEDFDNTTELYLVNKDSGTETSLAKSFENGELSDNITVETDEYGRWVRGAEYIFSIAIDEKPAEGFYLLRVKRGNETVDIWQFEMFCGQLYSMDPGETPIKPLSANDPAMLTEYYRIFVLGEAFEISTATSYYSIDGGNKWQTIGNITEYKKRDPKTGQLTSSKIFDKGFELWLSDTAPVGKKMPDSAKLIKFPKVCKRPNGPKLEVNYQLAHMGSDGVLNFECYDENLWVPVKKGTTELLSEGYIYRHGGVKETNRGDLKQTGKPDWEDKYYKLDAAGIPIPESDEENGGIKYSETSDRISYKSIKENYFVSAAPYVKDGVYYPASKPVKLAVSSYLKPKAMKIDYKKETLKLAAGAVFDDNRIYSGIVSVEVAKSKTSGVISVTEMLDNNWLDGSYQFVPTAKKPASCPVNWEFAYRGEMMELDKDGDRAKDVNITEYGKFTPSKALEFRQNGGKWGGFKAPNSGGTKYEYRTKATAKSGKLMFEGDWWMCDSIILKREDEEEVWAAGKVQTFEYGWGKNYKTKNGKTPTKEGIEWTNIG